MNELVAANVHMIRPHMADLPAWPLPAGYRLRGYRPGDEATWVALHLDAEPLFTVTLDHFEESFGAHRDLLPERMWFVQTAAGEEVGSIAAWWQDDWQGRGAWGQIHWVVVARAHQRRGLSKPMLAHALHAMARTHDRAMLGTNTLRLWALKSYLDCGFVPDPHERAAPDALAGWLAVQMHLAHPAIQAWLRDSD